MCKCFCPDERFSVFSDVTPSFLLSRGISLLVLDIDNTLEPYENPRPGEHVVAWLSSVKEAGIECVFLSNNCRERVELFNESLGLTAFYKAKKPFVKPIRRYMKEKGCTARNTAFLGDQIFTDVWAAKNVGATAYLVPPIKDKRDLLTRTKRLLERPILARYEKKRRKKT